MKNRIPGKYFLSIFVFTIYITYAISAHRTDESNYIRFGLLFLWIVVSFLINPSAFLKIFKSKIIKIYLLFLILVFFQLVVSTSLFSMSKYIANLLILFSPLYIYQYYSVIKNKRLLNLLFYISIFIWMLFVTRAISFYTLNPNAARRLISDPNIYDNIAIGGGYPIAIGSTILAVAMFSIINRVGVLKKIIVVLLVILLSILIYMTQSTITFLAYIIAFGLYLLLSTISNRNGSISTTPTNIIKISTYLFLFLILLLSLPILNTYLHNFLINSNTVIARRLSSITELLSLNSNNLSDNYLLSRLSFVQRSITVFLENPILGSGIHYAFDFQAGKAFGVGNHSEIFDILAIYGFVTGGVMLYLIYLSIKSYITSYSEIAKISIIILVLILGLFNPVLSFHFTFIMFFIIPILGKIIYGDNNENSVHM